MDCQTAQELLEAVTPGSSGEPPTPAASHPEWERPPELERAIAHARECRACAEVWEKIRFRDRAIAAAMHAVPVPEGLEERLFDSLRLSGWDPADHAHVAPAEAHDSATDPSTADSVTRLPQESTGRAASGTRRSALAALCAVAASVLVGVGLWSWLWDRPEFTLAQLQQAVPSSLADLPAFDGNFPVQLPREFEHQPAVEVESPARGLQLPGSPAHVGALREFAVRSPRGRVSRGVLLVVPIARVETQSRTLSTSLLTAPEESIGRRAVAAWSDDAYLYICFVDRESGSLHEIKQALAPGLT